jgi:hypothetical protein
MARLMLASLALLALATLPAEPAFAQAAPGQGPDILEQQRQATIKRLYGDPLTRIRPVPPSPTDQAVRGLYRNPVAPEASLGAVAAPAPATAVPASPAPDQRFARMDRDRDGTVSREEYLDSQMRRAPLAGEQGAGGPRREALARRFGSRFGGADANRDGRISPDEYTGAQNPRF